jgi:hypothetical protein
VALGHAIPVDERPAPVVPLDDSSANAATVRHLSTVKQPRSIAADVERTRK